MRAKEQLQLEAAHGNPYDPEQRLLQTEKQEQVHRLLGKLSERDREILVMKDMDDVGLEEISGLLGIPVGTVKSRLHRARRKAARLMGELI
jgi:RNA polymerase sigma-70 factor (ECF subfamily)